VFRVLLRAGGLAGVAIAALATIAALSAPTRQVPVTWVASSQVSGKTYYLGSVAATGEEFAPCRTPSAVTEVSDVEPPPTLASPSAVERLMCEWPRARDRYAPLTWKLGWLWSRLRVLLPKHDARYDYD
jgi:hypothetical protein